MTTKQAARKPQDEVPTVSVAPPPGAEAAPEADSAEARLRKTRRVVDRATYDPANPPKSDDVAVRAQAKVEIGDTVYGPGTRLTLPRATAEKLVKAGQATYD